MCIRDSISSYYSDYILRAIDAGIINGYNENGKTYFKPEKTLTRAEALTILYRAAGCIYNTSAYNSCLLYTSSPSVRVTAAELIFSPNFCNVDRSPAH